MDSAVKRLERKLSEASLVNNIYGIKYCLACMDVIEEFAHVSNIQLQREIPSHTVISHVFLKSGGIVR